MGRAVGFPFGGSVAVVTGAASGIGLALALDLARRGCALALVDRDAAGCSAAAAAARQSGVSVSQHVLDVTDKGGIAALPAAVLAEHGRVNILVNNAGVALLGRFRADQRGRFRLADVHQLRRPGAPDPGLPAAPVAGAGGATGQHLLHLRHRGTAGQHRLFRREVRHPRLQRVAAATSWRRTGVGVSVVHPGGVATNIARDARVSARIAPADAAQRQTAVQQEPGHHAGGGRRPHHGRHPTPGEAHPDRARRPDAGCRAAYCADRLLRPAAQAAGPAPGLHSHDPGPSDGKLAGAPHRSGS